MHDVKASWLMAHNNTNVLNLLSSEELHIMLLWLHTSSEYIRESVDPLCRDGADRTHPFSKIEWLKTPKRSSYKPF